jgi:hypothetical protein
MPDDTAFESEHWCVLNLTSEPAVAGPIVKPEMVMVTTVEGLMVAPENVMCR